ncbi:hypothetical protein [Zhongshania sp.]|uniref:hypothetical protein n=2 Tax=Zhongshania sp. TaxID=1971902 RepID=UPI0035636CE6
MRANYSFLILLLATSVGAVADVAQDYYQHLYGDYFRWTDVGELRASAYSRTALAVPGAAAECVLGSDDKAAAGDADLRAKDWLGSDRPSNSMLIATSDAQWLGLRNGEYATRVSVMRSQDGLIFAESEVLELSRNQQLYLPLNDSAYIQLIQVLPKVDISAGFESTPDCPKNRLAVWLGTAESLPEILQRREVYLGADNKGEWLRRSDGERQRYQHSRSAQVSQISLPALAFPRVELRLPLPLGSATELDVKWRVNGGEWHEQTVTAKLDHRYAWRGRNKQWQLLSERIEIDLPISNSQASDLEIISQSEVYLRVTGAATDDFLFAAKNDPRRVAKVALPQTQERLADALLRQAQAETDDWYQAAERVLSHDQPYTIAWKRYFRVLPPHSNSGLASQRRWLVPYTQKLTQHDWLAAGITQRPRWNSAALEEVERQEIFAIPAGSRVDFSLPAPTTSRNIRASVALNKEPQHLLYRSERRTMPLLVLAEGSVATTWPEAKVQSALVNTRSADEHIAVARYQWRLNADERDFSLENTGSDTAYISVEYEVAKPKPLSEQRYLSLLQSLASSAVIDWLRADSPDSDLPLLLARDLQALRDDLHRKRDQWLASTATSRQLNDARNRFYQTQARMAPQSEGPSLNEFIDANRRVNSAASPVAVQALRERHNILIAMGEHELAISLLKFELRNGSRELSQAASEVLQRTFHELGDTDALGLLTVVTFLQHGDARSTASLIRDLYKNGHSGDALRLALVWESNWAWGRGDDLVAEATVTDILLRAAVDEGWLETFRNRLNAHSSDMAEYWTAYALAASGDVGEARRRLANVSGADAKALMDLLAGSPQEQAERLMALPKDSLWSRWQGIDAGQNGRAFLQRIDSVGQDDPYHRYHLSGVESLRYQLHGDRHLRLEVRLVHDDAEARLDRWLRLRINKQWYRIPIFGSVASTTHVFKTGESSSDRYPGQRYYIDIEWRGEGELELLSDDQAVLAQLQESRLAIGKLRLEPLGLGCRDQQGNYLDHAIGHIDNGKLSKMAAPLAIQVKPFCQPQIKEGRGKLRGLRVWPALSEAQIAEISDGFDDTADVQTQLLAGIFSLHHGRVISVESFAKLQAAAYAQREQAPVANLLALLNTRSEWRKEELILSMAGSAKLARNWPAVSESAGLRRVLGNALPDGMDIRAGESFAAFIDAPEQSRLRVTVRAITPSYRKAVPAKIALQLDDQLLEKMYLSEQVLSREFPLPAGEHRVVLAFVDPLRQNLASVKVEYLSAGQWFSVDDEQQTRVLAANSQTPLTMYMHDAKWLRVDQFTNDKVERKYLFHPGGDFNVAAAFKTTRGLFRVHSLQQIDADLAAESLADYRFYQPALTVLQERATTLGDTGAGEPGFALFGEEPQRDSWATIGAYVKYSERSVLGLQASAEKQRALELGAHFRKKLDNWNHAYLRSDVFERRVNADNYSIGSENWLDLYPSGRPWTAHFKLDGYYQLSDNAYLDQAWSLNGDFAIKIPRDFNYKAGLSHEFAVFVRELSLDLADIQRIDTGAMDIDVFNRYRDTHRDGWRYQLDVDYAPYRDSILQGEFKLTGNQHSDNQFVDNARAGVTWQQLYGDWKIDLDYSLTQYLGDSDRGNGYLQQAAGLGLERIWWQPRWRWNARAYLRVNDGSGGPEAGIELSLDSHERRGLKDFSPRETAFRDLRVLRYRYQRDGMAVVE